MAAWTHSVPRILQRKKKKIIFDYISHNCDPPLVFITFENVSGPN